MSDDERYLDDGTDDPELLAALRDAKDITFEAPSPGTWDRIAAQLDPEVVPQAPSSGPHVDAPTQPTGSRGVSRRALWWIAGGTVVGAGLAVAGVQLAQAGRVIAETPLRTLDTNLEEGRAKLRARGGQLELEIDLPTSVSAGDGYVEVWLIHRDLKDLVSVGIYTGRTEEAFPLPRDVLDRGFVIVDLSLEHFDGNAGHSGDSLLRGQLPL